MKSCLLAYWAGFNETLEKEATNSPGCDEAQKRFHRGLKIVSTMQKAFFVLYEDSTLNVWYIGPRYVRNKQEVAFEETKCLCFRLSPVDRTLDFGVYLPYFSDYKMQPPPKLGGNGGASYSPNVAYLVYGGRGQWSGVTGRCLLYTSDAADDWLVV